MESAGFSTPSGYIRALIRDDQKRRKEEKLEALLLEGLNSGEPIGVTTEYWERKRAQLVEHYGKKTGQRQNPDTSSARRLTRTLMKSLTTWLSSPGSTLER